MQTGVDCLCCPELPPPVVLDDFINIFSCICAQTSSSAVHNLRRARRLVIQGDFELNVNNDYWKLKPYSYWHVEAHSEDWTSCSCVSGAWLAGDSCSCCAPSLEISHPPLGGRADWTLPDSSAARMETTSATGPGGGFHPTFSPDNVI